MKDRIDELLDIAYENNKLLKENNRMLKGIIRYINYTAANHHNDNQGEFELIKKRQPLSPLPTKGNKSPLLK